MHRRSLQSALSAAILPSASLLALLLAAVPVRAETTQPAAAQPSLPSGSTTPGRTGSPVVRNLIEGERPARVARNRAAARAKSRRHIARRTSVPRDLERPALAGVELLAPLSPPGEPPHLTVPMPGYALDSLVTPVTTPLPQIVCHRTRRDPDAPDPHLYREVPVDCEPDNP